MERIRERACNVQGTIVESYRKEWEEKSYPITQHHQK